MKNKLFLFLISLILISCDNDDKEKFSIELDKNSVVIDTKGGQESVKLVASGEWSITDVPEWISVSLSSGDYDAEIMIVVTENVELERRKATLVFACGDAVKTLEVEQLGVYDMDPFIEFSKNSLSIGIIGDEQKIKLTTNRPWTIKDVPTWLTVHPMSGDKSAEITISVAENKEPIGRGASLTFIGAAKSEILNISQFGLKDVIWTPSLPIFSLKYVSFTGALDSYDINVFNLFVNPDIKNKIYLGNLLSYNAGSVTNIPEFTGYTFNPITISTSAIASGIKSKTYVPSLNEQNAYAQEIINKKPTQNLSFISDNGTIEFYTYRRLYTLGIANMGVKLDEVVSGSSYKTEKMTKKYGLIFSFKQTCFSLDMDILSQLIKEELKEVDKNKGVAYVSSVYYGRVGLLIVESDTYFGDVKSAINKVISGQSLSAEESRLIDTSDISYVYFNNDNQAQIKKGHMDAVNAYKDTLAKNDFSNVYPIGFNLSSLIDHSIATISYSFKVSK
ncbi:BACON domain-containing protein [Dysgonomonas reticulitermitis]